jgi:hypothetical protein
LDAEVVVEATIFPDHTPLFLYLDDETGCQQGPRRFRYEEKWIKDDGYHKVVQNMWVRNMGHDQKWETIEKNLVQCQKGFKRW